MGRKSEEANGNVSLHTKNAAAAGGTYTPPGQGKAEPMGKGCCQAPQSVKQPPCHLLLSVTSRTGTANHLPCPACLVNTSGEITDQHGSASVGTPPSLPRPRRWVSIYRQAPPKWSFYQRTSEFTSSLQSNRLSLQSNKPFTFRYYFPISSNEATQHQTGAHVMVFPSLLVIELNRAFPRPFPLPRLVSSCSGCA